MAKQSLMFGDRNSLSISLSFPEPGRSSLAGDLTFGEIAVWLGDQLIWGRQIASGLQPVEWPLVDLVEFLSWAWFHIKYEEGYPIPVAPESPKGLEFAAERRWSRTPAETKREEAKILWEFEQAHDLSSAFDEAELPSILLLREGASIWVSTGSSSKKARVDAVLAAIEGVANAICSRIEDSEDPRSKKAIQAWMHREDLPIMDKIGICTGMSPADLRRLSGKLAVIDALEVNEQDFSPNEILVAARMAGKGTSIRNKALIASELKKIPRCESPRLDALANQAGQLFKDGDSPYDQGYELARFIRGELGRDGVLSDPEQSAADPESFLESLGVLIREFDIADPQIEAVACWGPQHGPAILVNTSGRRSQSARGRRSTLAHELCHLLADRASTLPLAEVLNGSAPRIAEARANAFSAEFLIPREFAASVVSRFESDRADYVAKRLADRFNVSKEIVAWQVRNTMNLEPETQARLRSLVSHPEEF